MKKTSIVVPTLRPTLRLTLGLTLACAAIGFPGIASAGPRLVSQASAELLSAASSGNLPEIRAAVEAGADLDARDPSLDTPLILAAKNFHPDAVELLVSLRAPVQSSNNVKRTVVMTLAMQGENDALQAVISSLKNPTPVLTAADQKGWTALLLTSWFGHADTAQILLANGVDTDINHQEQGGFTALIAASSNGASPEIVKMLLAVPGIELELLETSDNATALDVAQTDHAISKESGDSAKAALYAEIISELKAAGAVDHSTSKFRSSREPANPAR